MFFEHLLETNRNPPAHDLARTINIKASPSLVSWHRACLKMNEGLTGLEWHDGE